MNFNDYDEDHFTFDMIMREPEFKAMPKKDAQVSVNPADKKINLFSNGKHRLGKKKGKIILRKKKEKSSNFINIIIL